MALACNKQIMYVQEIEPMAIFRTHALDNIHLSRSEFTSKQAAF
jgi:hypothetical protein